MNKTLHFKGDIKTTTTIIDPNLPRALKRQWLATGALVHDALKNAYLNMVASSSVSGTVEVSEAYLILSGKAPVLRHKRTEVGRNHMLAKHDVALSLFGSHAHGIEGRLKVGFISKPDSDGHSRHTMKIIHATTEDLALMSDIVNEWAKNAFLGENTESGYGEVEAFWEVFMGDKLIGEISLKQGAASSQLEKITDCLPS